MASSTDWTYQSSLLTTSTGVAATMVVRRLIGDVLPGDKQLTDGEINFAVQEYSNYYLAGAECARWLAAQFSRQCDLVQGDLQTNYSQKAKAYAAMAIDLQQRGMQTGPGSMPYIGGVSVTDKAAQVTDPDRVTPQFNIGMQDNLLPVGVGSGNETPGNPSGGNGPDGTPGATSP